MSLLALPPELFQIVIEWTVLTVGLEEAFGLRAICRLFDQEVMRATWALPTFETSDVALIPENCRLPTTRTLNIEMKTRLILIKLKSRDAVRRPLCRAINGTLDSLFEPPSQEISASRQECIDILAREASRSRLADIVAHLVPLRESSFPDRPLCSAQWFLGSLARAAVRNSWRWLLTRILAVGLLDSDLVHLASEACRQGDVRALHSILGRASALHPHRFSLPIILAAERGHLGAVDALLDFGVTICPAPAFSPLVSASRAGHLDVVRRLVERSAPLKGNVAGLKPLLVAASRGHVDVVLFLLEAGADPNPLFQPDLSRGLSGNVRVATRRHPEIMSMMRKYLEGFPSDSIHLLEDIRSSKDPIEGSGVSEDDL
ncbi:hypothetical protein BCR34DRAFT_571113 [Clohesyomyces aquaticus]|uniref:Uncharacterized protein n=1 Tax=Clohesyomyces aquaticus TaxID=1231657 RepID=A0A1Y1Z919_9PLEO|nr:hypothetical protein BCR34DRAFT_571113 [Clohesyomyces aquaticus]